MASKAVPAVNSAVEPRKEVKEVQVQAELPKLPDVETFSIPEDILQQLAAWRMYPADIDKQLQRASEITALKQLHADMMGTSPALLHRFPATGFETADATWSSPIFSACGRLWSVRMGPVGVATGTSGGRYFCLLPHGHTDRLKCSFLFAKQLGKDSGSSRYKERRVHDWPEELAGHPWGPSLPTDELSECLQADGSLQLMIHAVGLGGEDDPFSKGTSAPLLEHKFNINSALSSARSSNLL